MIQFLLNNEVKQVDHLKPSTSVLDFLRLEQGRVGTKEGCASGDCGACTVVVSEVATSPDGKQTLKYKSINACITPLATLDGHQLITVEDLKQGDNLHPVQQAMVDTNGSQCGFCTPGFVMSMFAFQKNTDQPTRHDIEEALGGNLCRCTGYNPIIKATQKVFEQSVSDQFDELQQQTVQKLNVLAEYTNSGLHNGEQAFYIPKTSSELAQLLETHKQAKIVAGGTDLCLEFTQFLRETDTLIYVGKVKELVEVSETHDAIEIGAAATYSQCHQTLTHYYPSLQELLDRLGSKQIRNQGTLGGNIANASPIGDMPPVLLALKATLVLNKNNERRTVAIEDYFISYKKTVLQPAEFIEKIVIPKPKQNSQLWVYKISKRLEDDISATCGAFYLEQQGDQITEIRIAFGGMAEIPKRASHSEQQLQGREFTQANINKAKQALAQDFQPITDFRASSEYRMTVSQNLLQRLFWEHKGCDQAIRIDQHA